MAPPPGVLFEVTTQRRTPSGRRVDLELAAYEGLVRRALLWVEVKAGAGFQPQQLEDYAIEVRDAVFGELNGRVLALVPSEDRKPVDTTPGPARWEVTTWSEVATWADRLGQKWE